MKRESDSGKEKKIYTSYLRNHSGGDFEAKEEAKISRDKSRISKLSRKADKLASGFATEIPDEELEEAIAAIEYRAKKTSGNVNTHKKRLKELKKNIEFM